MIEVEQEESDNESICKKPCDPNVGCSECASYWERMIVEGFWDRLKHQWTAKGWRELTK